MPDAPPPPSERAKRLADIRARRAAKLKRREDMLAGVISGADHTFIAKTLGLSVATVRREVNRAIDSRRLQTPDRYVRLQIERLNKTFVYIDHRLENGDLSAIDYLLKVVERLDRYHGLAPIPPAAEPHRRLGPPSAPLALTHAPEVAEKSG